MNGLSNVSLETVMRVPSEWSGYAVGESFTVDAFIYGQEESEEGRHSFPPSAMSWGL